MNDIQELIKKYIGNIGNRPELNRSIEQLAYVIYSNQNIKRKDQLYFCIECYIGNPHQRSDLTEAFGKLAGELEDYLKREEALPDNVVKLRE